MKFEPTLKTSYEPTRFPYFLPQYAEFNESDRQECDVNTRGGLSKDVPIDDGTRSEQEVSSCDP